MCCEHCLCSFIQPKLYIVYSILYQGMYTCKTMLHADTVHYIDFFIHSSSLHSIKSVLRVENPALYLLKRVYYCVWLCIILVIEVVIPTLETLVMTASIVLPNMSISVFGNMTPMFQMPSAVVLNQIEKEGTVQQLCIINTCTVGSNNLLQQILYVCVCV